MSTFRLPLILLHIVVVAYCALSHHSIMTVFIISRGSGSLILIGAQMLYRDGMQAATLGIGEKLLLVVWI